MELSSKLAKIGLATGGLVAGVVLAGTVSAQASSPSPAATSGGAIPAVGPDAHPGGNGGDGVPEGQEHLGVGRGLDLSGAVTAVGAGTVTIRSSAGTPTTYAVTSHSDIDKNGEAALKDLAPGDAVTFSTDGAATRTIDRLHAGDATKDAPSGSVAVTPAGAGTPTA
ncbi:MAG: hypothetical protein NVS3B26_17580 [Mycobacteriales bacterium]